jgi:hypothetical protein
MFNIHASYPSPGWMDHIIGSGVGGRGECHEEDV